MEMSSRVSSRALIVIDIVTVLPQSITPLYRIFIFVWDPTANVVEVHLWVKICFIARFQVSQRIPPCRIGGRSPLSEKTVFFGNIVEGV